MMRRWGSKSGAPLDPGSVVPRSQSTTRQCVRSPGTTELRYEVTCTGSSSKLMHFSSVVG
jgi:hypothetical protein